MRPDYEEVPMFYVKTNLGEGAVIKTEITDENVFTRCPQCGSEFSVDLADVFTDGEGDLYGSSIYCESCSRHLRPDICEGDA